MQLLFEGGFYSKAAFIGEFTVIDFRRSIGVLNSDHTVVWLS